MPSQGTKPSAPTAPGQTTKPCPPVAPGQTTKPNVPTAPSQGTKPSAPTAPGQGTKPSAPTAPGQGTKPSAPTTPSQGTKPSAPTTPGQGAKPCPANKKECNKKDNCDTNNQKPFMLDHFKMIVNTLKKLGLEENQIVTYIKEGKKLEDILKAENIKPKKFKKCMLKEYYKVVDTAQKSGQITCEQAKQLKAAIKETVNNWLPNK